jgi:hypothetical protein
MPPTSRLAAATAASSPAITKPINFWLQNANKEPFAASDRQSIVRSQASVRDIIEAEVANPN